MDLSQKIQSALEAVEKPTRYTGGEWNSVEKEQAQLRFALCFPDVYEIGMSHLGSRILYEVLNDRADFACERVYAPWPDMEAQMRQRQIPLFSLETKRPLREFDIVGFSLLYEMCYTNILTMLDLAGIPFYARERGEDMPLILCGGPCACNAEPVADLMDAVLVGDGEELIWQVSECCCRAKKAGLSKQETLLALSRIEGVYIPSFYEPQYGADGLFNGFVKTRPAAPDQVTRRIVRDLDAAPYLKKPVVPYLSIVHDRVAVELFRGCTRGCRFCQAGYIYRPVRERKKETLQRQTRQLLDCTGYDEVSLFSLSSGDYSAIHELVPELVNELYEEKVSLSLPSLRVDSFLKDDLEKIQSVRKTGLTFAPEAGTQRLRDVINKGVTEEDLLRAVQDAFEAGWSGVKLYFMLGLPTETDEDLLGIAELARKVSRLFYAMPKEKRGKGLRLTVSVASFVPKPFTAFQWVPQCDLEELKRRQSLLRDAIKGIRGAELSYHLSPLSVLEGVFARGDRRLTPVLVSAWEKGCRFDSWTEYFHWDRWQEAFAENGADMAFYAQRERSLQEHLPWEITDMLVCESFLKEEYRKAMTGETTPDCRLGCHGCFGAKHADICQV